MVRLFIASHWAGFGQHVMILPRQQAPTWDWLNGHAAALGCARSLSLKKLLDRHPKRERSLAATMILTRFPDPHSKLTTARYLCSETLTHTLGQELGVRDADEDELVRAHTWVGCSGAGPVSSGTSQEDRSSPITPGTSCTNTFSRVLATRTHERKQVRLWMIRIPTKLTTFGRKDPSIPARRARPSAAPWLSCRDSPKDIPPPSSRPRLPTAPKASRVACAIMASVYPAANRQANVRLLFAPCHRATTLMAHFSVLSCPSSTRLGSTPRNSHQYSPYRRIGGSPLQ